MRYLSFAVLLTVVWSAQLNVFAAQNGSAYYLADRIDQVSGHYLGRSYSNEPIDPNDFWRLDSFDNVSFVESMVALATSYDLEDFKKTIATFHAPPGEDWALHNIKQGTVRDVTDSLATYAPAADCLQKLKGAKVETLYISRQTFNDKKFLERLPSGLIVTFFRGASGVPERALLVRKSSGHLYLRLASAQKGKVVEELFVDYVNSQSDIIGLNLLSPLPLRVF